MESRHLVFYNVEGLSRFFFSFLCFGLRLGLVACIKRVWLSAIFSGKKLGLPPNLLSESDQDSLGATDVAEPVDVFVVHDFIHHSHTVARNT